MKILIVTLIVSLFTSYAQAAQVKLTWTHDMKGIDGSVVVLTAFKAYWSIQNTQTQGILPLGPPIDQPWKNLNGLYTWSKTINNDQWEPGTTVCFYMTALSGAEESGPSPTVCTIISSIPNMPNIVTIGTP